MLGLPDGEKTLKICNIPVSSSVRHMPDGQTDGWTDILPWHSPHYAYMVHGKKMIPFILRALILYRRRRFINHLLTYLLKSLGPVLYRIQ